MLVLRLLLSTVLFFVITTALVVPTKDITTGASHSSNDLTKLHPMNKPNLLTCRNTNQRMSCYGGPSVTLGTCKEVCTCENGRVSCPTYKFCDDATMDTFCGGLCACSVNMPNKLRANEGETLISAHRYRVSGSTRLRADEEDVDEDDEGLLRRHERRSFGDSDATGASV